MKGLFIKTRARAVYPHQRVGMGTVCVRGRAGQPSVQIIRFGFWQGARKKEGGVPGKAVSPGRGARRCPAAHAAGHGSCRAAGGAGGLRGGPAPWVGSCSRSSAGRILESISVTDWVMSHSPWKM